MLSQTKLTPRDSQLSGLQDASALLAALFAISSKEGPGSIASELAEQLTAFGQADHCRVSYGTPRDHSLTTLGVSANFDAIGDPSFGHLDYPEIAEAHSHVTSLHVISDGDAPHSELEARLIELELSALYCMPLCAHDRTIGMVQLFYAGEKNSLSEDQLSTLAMLCDHAGIIIDQSILLEKANQRARQLEGLRRASLTVTSSLELNDVFNAVLENAMNLSKDAMDAHIFLYEADRLVFAQALWADGSTDTKFIEPRKDGLTYNVARKGEMIVVEDIRDHELFPNPAFWGDNSWTGSIIGIPLKIGSQVVGVMNIAYQNARVFDSNELSTLGLLAAQAAIAIENARLHRLVREQSLTDPLTGAYNRRAFNKHLSDLLAYGEEHDGTFTMMMIDLNNFKKVNDTYGHSAGDLALINITAILEAGIRGKDFLARYGGDEFAILLPETDLSTAETIRKRLEQAVIEGAQLEEGGKPLNLSMTVGIAEYPTHGRSFDTIVSYADNEMYRHKLG